MADSTMTRIIRVVRISKSPASCGFWPTLVVELQSDELGLGFSYVGHGMRVAPGQPLHVAGFEMPGHGTLTDDVAANFEIADRDQQVWTRVMMFGERRLGL